MPFDDLLLRNNINILWELEQTSNVEFICVLFSVLLCTGEVKTSHEFVTKCLAVITIRHVSAAAVFISTTRFPSHSIALTVPTTCVTTMASYHYQ